MHSKRQIALALIGESRVGKTTIIKLLDENAESRGTSYQIETEDIVYTAWELQTSSSEPQRLAVFATSFLKNSPEFDRFVIIVSDSSKEDVNKIKYSLKFLRQTFPDTRFAIIANKQDVPGALSPSQVKSILGIETHGLTAINPTCKQTLFKILQQKFSS